MNPMNPAKMPPRMIWPWAPMLNSPARKPIAEAEAGEDQRRRDGQRLGQRPDRLANVSAWGS